MNVTGNATGAQVPSGREAWVPASLAHRPAGPAAEMTLVSIEGSRSSSLAGVATVPLEETGPPRVVLAGAPTTACAVIHEDADIEVGIWTVTPGSFRSVKHGVSESMHFIAGAGRIEHPDGTATVIAPGTVLHLQDGWEGTWHVTEPVRKSYVIVRTPATAGTEDLR